MVTTGYKNPVLDLFLSGIFFGMCLIYNTLGINQRTFFRCVGFAEISSFDENKRCCGDAKFGHPLQSMQPLDSSVPETGIGKPGANFS